MKKILSLFLAILMSLSVASMIGAAEEAAIVDEATPELIATKEDTSIYEEAIQYLTEYGILHGKEDGLPHAEDPIKRYEMALFVSRISTGWVDDAQWKVWWVGSDATVAEEWYDREHDVTGFTDLEGTAAVNFLGALSYASQKGIILGYGDGKFGPEDGIRYEDALTMLCRVLEYNNLEWPWGYIEKAVNLGLTKGIPSTVAYRDRLNRGEVAQLIYNALFAEMKNGGTLASRYFNGALEWKNIIITGAGYGRLLPNDLLKDGKLYDLGDYIAFRIVDEKDGSLDASQTYFVNNKDLNWLDKRYERYLGFAYKALFTVDEKGYATLYHVKDLKGETVKNRGRLAKVDDAYPIDTFLKNRTLVSKFTLKGTYLNNYNEKYNPSANEFILRNALQTPPKDENQGIKIAVQWDSGNNNIVEYEYLKDADGNVVKDAAGNPMVDMTKVTNIWYWNSELRVYFSVLFDKDGNYYGIKVLDQDEIAKLLEKMNKHEYKGGLNIIAPDKPGTTAYADLTPFKLLDDPDYNYGLYEQYGIGRYRTTDKAKDAEDKEKNGFYVEGLESLAEYYWNNKLDGTKAYPADYTNYVVDKIPTEGKGILGWINDKDGLVPEDKDYIIYSFDEATRELKVIKIINDKTFDENNYIGSGVLRGWKLADKKFNIDGKDYYFDYNELLGNGLKFHGGDPLAVIEQNAFTNFFRGLFNQYVNFLVVDGKVVWMAKTSYVNDIIVVDSYAGLSSDGYIVVNGYNTADMKFSQFKIGSYNGWVKGDYFYYPDNATVDQAFARGTVYRLTSVDKSGKDPIYYVYTIAQVLDKEGENGEVVYDFSNLESAYADKGAVLDKNWKIELDAGYKSIKGGDWVKAKSSDKYIFVLNDPYLVGFDYAPIIVYQGKGGNGWKASGTLVNGTGDDDPHVVVGAYVEGFNMDEWDISYVLFQRYNYDFGAYDSTYAGDWYLLGASNFTATVLNLYTGKEETVVALNKDLKKGYAYPCINGQIVADGKGNAKDTVDGLAPYIAAELDFAITSAYPTNRKYFFGSHFLVEGTKAYDLFDKEKFSKDVLSPDYNAATPKLLSDAVIAKGGAKDLSTGNTVILVTAEKIKDGVYGKITNWVKLDNQKALNKAIEGLDPATVEFWYVNTIGGDTVIYVAAIGDAPFEAEPIADHTPDVIDFSLTDELGIKIPAYVVPYFYGMKNEDNITIDGIGVQFETIASTHANIAEHEFYFGDTGYCDAETMEAAVNGAITVDAVHSSYYAAHSDGHDTGANCDMIKGIKLSLDPAVTITVPVYDAETKAYYDANDTEKAKALTVTTKDGVDTVKNGITFKVEIADDVSSTSDTPVKSTLYVSVWIEATFTTDIDGEKVLTGWDYDSWLESTSDFRGTKAFATYVELTNPAK